MHFSFDEWTLDADRRLLSHRGDPVSVSPKAFDLLRLLAERHDRAFSKAELHQYLWPDTFVSDGSLTLLVAEIRQALNDDADQPRFIRTVRRFGYAFCAPVSKTSAPEPVAGSPRAWLIWGDRSIGVPEGETVLGRALDAAIRFDVAGVSRRHARLHVAGPTITIEDLGSQNGTYVRSERVSRRTPVSDGDEVRLGPVTVLIRIVAADGSTLPM